MEHFDYDGDSVICMEDMGVGAAEILEYARAVLPRRELQVLVRGLEAMLRRPEPFRAHDALSAEELFSRVADAVSD